MKYMLNRINKQRANMSIEKYDEACKRYEQTSDWVGQQWSHNVENTTSGSLHVSLFSILTFDTSHKAFFVTLIPIFCVIYDSFDVVHNMLSSWMVHKALPINMKDHKCVMKKS